MRVPLPIYGGLDAGPRPETRAAVHGALSRGGDPVAVAERGARGVDAVASEVARAREASDGGEAAPACARGCAYCCHQRVELTAPEAFLLARGVRSHTSELAARVEATARALDGLSSRDHHLRQIPCALLADDGSCAVHPARPIACRRAHSTDASVCAAVRREPALDVRIPDAPTLAWNTAAVVLGFYEGSLHAGQPPHLYELHAALRLALASPDAEARWRQGEDLLASARTRAAEDLPAILGRADPDRE